MDIPHASENTVFRELVRQGHNVNTFNYKSIEDNTSLIKELHKNILDKKPDFLLCHKCSSLKNKDILEIKDKFEIPVVAWNFDLFNGYESDYEETNHLFLDRLNKFEEQMTAFDVVFGAEAGKETIKRYKDKGANYYPLKLGADPEWFDKVPYDSEFEKYRCNLSFLGTIYNKLRKKMQDTILSKPFYPYKEFAGYTFKGVEKPKLFMQDISKFSNVNKITIGCNFRNDIEGYWSKRCYELMAANIFMIQSHVKGIEKEGFKDKKNTVFYYNDDFEQMCELIKYYLDNEDERNKIKQKGYELIHKFHMQSNRNKTFFKVLKQNKVV